MANPVTVGDIADRWRPLSTAEEVTAWALLEDAWALATLRVPDIEARLADESLSAAIVRMVIAAMVLRVLKNPDGKQQESIEDYSYTMGANASGSLWLTEDEMALLEVQPLLPDGGFTIRPYGAPDTPTSVLGWS